MSKIIAIYLGPEGLGLIGQLNNFILIATMVAGGCISTGVTKYIAEFRKNEPDSVAPFISTAFRIILFTGCLTALVLILFSEYIARLTLLNVNYQYIFLIFGSTILLYSGNNFLISILNGYKEFKKFNVVNSVTSLIGLLISLTLIYIYNIKGALISLVVNQSLVFAFTIIFVRKEPWFKKEFFFNNFNYLHFKKLFSFILMTLVSTVCVPLVQLILRRYVIENFSLTRAGWWEAINRISNVYLMFIVTTLTTYYLPRLSEINQEGELRKEILKVYKVVIPFILILSTIIYLFRHVIIAILFTQDFQQTEQLFLFQLIGDIFKIASWLLAFLMIAKAMTTRYLITEVLFSATFLLLSIFLLNKFDIIGLTYAYAINYLLYFISMCMIFRKILFKKRI